MDLRVVGSCDSCCKNKVCKYQKERNNLEYAIQDKIIIGVYDKEGPVRLESSCSEWDNGVKERRF